MLSSGYYVHILRRSCSTAVSLAGFFFFLVPSLIGQQNRHQQGGGGGLVRVFVRGGRVGEGHPGGQVGVVGRD